MTKSLWKNAGTFSCLASNPIIPHPDPLSPCQRTFQMLVAKTPGVLRCATLKGKFRGEQRKWHLEEIVFRGLCHPVFWDPTDFCFFSHSPLKSPNCRNHLCCLNSGRSPCQRSPRTAPIYTVRFLAARRATGPPCPSLKIQVSSLSPFIQSLLLPSPTPFCCCCASDGTSHTLSRALPVARPFCSPSWMHRPIWGELRLKDPCCPSMGSRALGKQNDFIPQLPSPRCMGTLAKCADTTNCGFWASKDLRASRPNPPLSRGWKCPKEGKQSKAEDPYLPGFFCRWWTWLRRNTWAVFENPLGAEGTLRPNCCFSGNLR